MDREALRKRLSGQRDPRGMVGILSRGKNIYSATSTSAHSGGGSQFGRPVGTKDSYKRAARRRMKNYG